MALDKVKDDMLQDNLVFPGSTTQFPSLNTTQRDALTPAVGMLIYNSSIGNLQQYTQDSGWQSIAAAPTITSLNVSDIHEVDDPQTIVITGNNFDSTATGVLLTSGGATVTPTTSTRNSSSQITIVFSGSDTLSTDQGPYDVKVTNGTGLTAILTDSITLDNQPVWSTNAGSLFTVYEDFAAGATLPSGTTTASYTNVVATEPESGTVTYSITSGAIPSGLTLSSGGVFSGTANAGPSGYASAGQTHNFTVTASDGTGNTTPRAFSILRKWTDGSSTEQAGISCWYIRDRVGSSATLSDGLYYINPTTGPSGTFQVYCDMNTDGGGWTMLLDTNTAYPPHNSNTDVFSGSLTNSFYSDTVRAPMHPTNDDIGSGASNSKCYARDWEDYHINNRGSANNGRRDFMVQQREGGSTFNSSGKDKFIVYDVDWLPANTSQTNSNFPGTQGTATAYGYWSMDTSNGSAKWGDGTSYTVQNTYISMSSCFNDASSCDEWHSTHVRDFQYRYYRYLDTASTSSPVWGHSYGTGSDPANYNYAGWYDGSTQSKEMGSGDRDKAISYWCRNNGTW